MNRPYQGILIIRRYYPRARIIRARTYTTTVTRINTIARRFVSSASRRNWTARPFTGGSVGWVIEAKDYHDLYDREIF
jgi:hypothetical protein